MFRSGHAARVAAALVIVVAMFVLSAAVVSAGAPGLDSGAASEVTRFQEQGRQLGDSDFRDKAWIAVAGFLLVVIVDAVVIARILQNRRHQLGNK